MFVEAYTRPVLSEVCRRLNITDTDIVLFRHHSNAVYAVADVVVKISPANVPFERAERIVAVVRWMTERKFPTVQLSDRCPDQPFSIAGHAVTVWERLDPAIEQPITTGELGVLLSDLHSLPAPPFDLPTIDPILGIHRSIEGSQILSQEDRSLLLDRLHLLADKWTAMNFPRGTSLIQSDPQTRNALRTFDGLPVLADWDGAALGPREWDLATIAVHCRRFTQPAASSFHDFVATYGWNPESWEGFEDLCQLRELQMITTNARKSPPGTAAASEVHRRIAGLRQGAETISAWAIL